ncbi:MAG TPA: hypothetical protein VL593_10715 [Ramlibacter sp.]|jgi:hypothetical protein|nr:hypothetical protein [Ramlibacter sp.]
MILRVNWQELSYRELDLLQRAAEDLGSDSFDAALSCAWDKKKLMDSLPDDSPWPCENDFSERLAKAVDNDERWTYFPEDLFR